MTAMVRPYGFISVATRATPAPRNVCQSLKIPHWWPSLSTQTVARWKSPLCVRRVVEVVRPCVVTVAVPANHITRQGLLGRGPVAEVYRTGHWRGSRRAWLGRARTRHDREAQNPSRERLPCVGTGRRMHPNLPAFAEALTGRFTPSRRRRTLGEREPLRRSASETV